jgi:hypothetical protein
VRDLLADDARIIRVINGIFRDAAQVFVLYAEFVEQRFQAFLFGVSRVVARKRDFHFWMNSGVLFGGVRLRVNPTSRRMRRARQWFVVN